MSDNEQEQPLEVLPPSAIMAMEKAQIDMQIATAHQYPRSLELFKKRALSMATLDPETADSCIYTRPVGKEGGKQKFAEGPSIRLAEIVAVSYGNLRAASKVVEQTERYVKCTGMAHDLESNTAMSADCIESTVTKEGMPYSERQRALIAKVCGAKALRDAIFKVVPRALCKPIMDSAKKVAAGQDKPLDERRKRAQAWISTLRIDEARVFAALGVSGWSDVTADHLITITGVKTAMADGDVTIDEAFPDIPRAPKPTGHQQATAPTTPTKPPVKPPTAVPSASEPAKAPITPPEASKTPEPPATLVPEPNQGGVAPDDTAELAAMGLAPEFENGTKPEQQPEKQGEKGEFVPNPNESAGLQGVRRLMHDSDVTDAQLIKWAVKNKLAKDGQSLPDLAEQKLASIAKSWAVILPKIQAIQ